MSAGFHLSFGSSKASCYFSDQYSSPGLAMSVGHVQHLEIGGRESCARQCLFFYLLSCIGLTPSLETWLGWCSECFKKSSAWYQSQNPSFFPQVTFYDHQDQQNPLAPSGLAYLWHNGTKGFCHPTMFRHRTNIAIPIRVLSWKLLLLFFF